MDPSKGMSPEEPIDENEQPGLFDSPDSPDSPDGPDEDDDFSNLDDEAWVRQQADGEYFEKRFFPDSQGGAGGEGGVFPEYVIPPEERSAILMNGACADRFSELRAKILGHLEDSSFLDGEIRIDPGVDYYSDDGQTGVDLSMVFFSKTLDFGEIYRADRGEHYGDSQLDKVVGGLERSLGPMKVGILNVDNRVGRIVQVRLFNPGTYSPSDAMVASGEVGVVPAEADEGIAIPQLDDSYGELFEETRADFDLPQEVLDREFDSTDLSEPGDMPEGAGGVQPSPDDRYAGLTEGQIRDRKFLEYCRENRLEDGPYNRNRVRLQRKGLDDHFPDIGSKGGRKTSQMDSWGLHNKFNQYLRATIKRVGGS